MMHVILKKSQLKIHPKKKRAYFFVKENREVAFKKKKERKLK